MSVQKLKISKLFYNKWPYKIECTLPGAWAASTSRLNNKAFDEWVNTVDKVHPMFPQGIKVNKPVVKEVRDVIMQFQDKDIKLRGEKEHLRIYCKDNAVFSEMTIALEKWITKTWEPTSEEELGFFLSNDTRKTVVDKLPHDKYRYRLTLKEKIPDDVRKNFYDWSKKYSTQILISKGTSEWMNLTKKWSFSPFMYVTDDKMLTLIGIYLGGEIKHIKEFILRENINTV
jgi:hypothetical protein